LGFWASLPRPPLGYCTLVALAVEVAVLVVVVAALPFVNLFLTSSVSSSATLAICYLVLLLLLLPCVFAFCCCCSGFLFHAVPIAAAFFAFDGVLVLMDSVGRFASLVAFLR